MYQYLAVLLLGITVGGSFEHYRLTSTINEMLASSAKEKEEAAVELLKYKDQVASMSDQLATVYSQKQSKTDIRYKTITKEVDRVQASPDSNCSVSDDWVRIYNEALKSSSDPPSVLLVKQNNQLSYNKVLHLKTCDGSC